MSKQTIKRIHIAYGVVLTLLILTVGAALILSCLDIYRSGDRPFSTESVKTHFSAIALPVYLCIVWAVGGFVLAVALPLEKGKLKSRTSSKITLSRLSGKLDLSRCPAELARDIRSLRVWRLVLILTSTLFYLAGATLALIYVLNKNNFPAADDQFNAEILRGTLKIARYLGPPFFHSIVVSLLNHGFRKREIALTKEAITLCATRPDLCPSPHEPVDDNGGRPCPIGKIKSAFTKHQKTILTVVRCVVLGVGALFVLLGIFNGGMSDVVQKAIKICTECIGLG